MIREYVDRDVRVTFAVTEPDEETKYFNVTVRVDKSNNHIAGVEPVATSKAWYEFPKLCRPKKGSVVILDSLEIIQ